MKAKDTLVGVAVGTDVTLTAGVLLPAVSFPREFPSGAEAKVFLTVLLCVSAALTGLIAKIIRAIILRKQIFRNTEVFPE
ncbi:hypothetical protein [Methanoregula sp.]|jgi:hypothetical protein|uniref:hypothetical protein n=1 Tax=Methanoregula sp. TaxID=2052170 RepID=UPI003C29949F